MNGTTLTTVIGSVVADVSRFALPRLAGSCIARPHRVGDAATMILAVGARLRNMQGRSKFRQVHGEGLSMEVDIIHMITTYPNVNIAYHILVGEATGCGTSGRALSDVEKFAAFDFEKKIAGGILCTSPRIGVLALVAVAKLCVVFRLKARVKCRFLRDCENYCRGGGSMGGRVVRRTD